MSAQSSRRDHWAHAYTAKPPTEVSWFQVRPDLSVDLIQKTSTPPDASIVDVGGGASTLVDCLQDAGRTSVTVLDVAEPALAVAKSRLRDRAKQVHWIVADITKWVPTERAYDIWHDRAVFHFLTNPEDQSTYVSALRSALRSGAGSSSADLRKVVPRAAAGSTSSSMTLQA
jgi:trans-aconitate methyltransferase